MRDVRGPFDHVGAGYTQVWRVVGMEREGSWRVTGCAPRRWRTVEADTPIGARLRVRDGFERVGAGCRVSIEVVLDAPHGLLGRALDGLLAEPLLRRALRGNRERVRRALGGDA